MSSFEYSTQFTEDAFAKEDRRCEGKRDCRKLIKKGEPCIYMASIDVTRPGRFVCETCLQRYLNAPSTTMSNYLTYNCQV